MIDCTVLYALNLLLSYEITSLATRQRSSPSIDASFLLKQTGQSHTVASQAKEISADGERGTQLR